MAIAPGERSTQTSSEDSDFGANDWLLEEMYERYQEDPTSVETSWADYFASRATNGHAPAAAAPAPAAAPARSAPPSVL